MPVSVSRALTDLQAGRYRSALALLWQALPSAQDSDDLETLRLIWSCASQVALRGGVEDARDAREIMEAVSRLHPQAREPDDGQSASGQLPMTTGSEIPGCRIVKLIGPIFGVTVRSRDVATQWGARIQGGTVGGELRGMTEVMEQSRVQVLARLEQRARELGANAVIAMRFDVSQMAETWTEIAAYGTAVVVECAASEAAEDS